MFKQKPPRLLNILILTTVTIVFWVFFSLSQILIKKTETQVPDVLLEQIDPTLDITILNAVENRLFFEEGQVQALPEQEEVQQQIPLETSTEEISPTPPEESAPLQEIQ